MVVTCVTTSNPCRVGPEHPSPEPEPLTVGREYDVLALESTRSGHWAGPRVYLFDDDGFGWPRPYPIDMFDVTDPTLPPDWICQCHPVADGATVIISFPDWANDLYFYGRLVDEDVTASERLARHVSSERDRRRRRRRAREALRSLLLECGAPEHETSQVVCLLEYGEPELAREDVDSLVEADRTGGRQLTDAQEKAIETAFRLHAPGMAQP